MRIDDLVGVRPPFALLRTDDGVYLVLLFLDEYELPCCPEDADSARVVTTAIGRAKAEAVAQTYLVGFKKIVQAFSGDRIEIEDGD